MVAEIVGGTWFGSMMDSNRFSISGWVNGSYTPSSTAHSNSPITWNDRANDFLLQQGWVRIDRSVVTSGTTDWTVGFRADILTGTDYRFTLPRGLWNSQLVNANGGQNLYGVDPVQFYANAYFPTLFRGTEIRVGRTYDPAGYESLEAVSNPLLSRSYLFFNTPFTLMAIAGVV